MLFVIVIAILILAVLPLWLDHRAIHSMRDEYEVTQSTSQPGSCWVCFNKPCSNPEYHARLKEDLANEMRKVDEKYGTKEK